MSPTPPSSPVLTCGGTVGFTGVPAGWYLIIEPGDHLYTSDFGSITLAPGDYTYQFRDAQANDMVGGKFAIELCPTAMPSESAAPTASASPTASAVSTPSGHGPSPSAMPDTTTGPSGSGGDPTPMILLGLVLLFGGAGFAWFKHRQSASLNG